jgi:hypothetical protein
MCGSGGCPGPASVRCILRAVQNTGMAQPRVTDRPSFTQRDAYRDVLSRGYAEGRLDDEEFEARLTRMGRCETLKGLEAQISGLPRGGLPVPQGARVTPGEAGRGPRRVRWGRVFTAAAAVGIVGGVLAGNGGMLLPSSSGDDAGEVPESAGESEEDPVLDRAAVLRGLEALSEESTEVSDLSLYPGYASAQVAVGGNRYDDLLLYDGREPESSPGGTYEPGTRDALVFDVHQLDPELVARMVESAPEVYEETTGMAGVAPESVWARVDSSGSRYVGVDMSRPLIEVRMAANDYGEGGGSVVWSADGGALVKAGE